MAPKEKQLIEIEKSHRDPLLSLNHAVTVDCSDFLGTALKGNDIKECLHYSGQGYAPIGKGSPDITARLCL